VFDVNLLRLKVSRPKLLIYQVEQGLRIRFAQDVKVKMDVLHLGELADTKDFSESLTQH
jgi:hypothetical protein